ncbi:hypothetical protein V8J88_04190 [Massilia sp. W12]|uniref:hypothetical protein n=1 Tax=Massilia sp. W12 TaxID=3126507 RepID=UPI0030D4AE14
MPTILYTPTARPVTMKDDVAVASSMRQLQSGIFSDARRACHDSTANLAALCDGGTLVIVAHSDAGQKIGAQGMPGLNEAQLLQQLLDEGLPLDPSENIEIHLICSLSGACVRRDYVWEHQAPFAERLAQELARAEASRFLVHGYAGFLGESAAYTQDLNTTDESKNIWRQHAPRLQWQVEQGQWQRIGSEVWLQERAIKVELRRKFSVHLTVRKAA